MRRWLSRNDHWFEGLVPFPGLKARYVAVTVVFVLGLAAADSSVTYLTFGSLPPDLQVAMHAYGNRLQKKGYERVTLTGTVSRKGASAVTFQAIRELPTKIHYQEQSAATLAFDGSTYNTSSSGVQTQDADLVETLVYDTPEALFYARSNGWPIRKLGSRFRMDGQTGKTYSGSSYDVYAVAATVQQSGKSKQQTKYYHVNSDTQMIERIHYQDASNSSTKVMVILSDWTTVSGNVVPATIRRLENGTEVLRFKVTGATIGASASDGVFQKP